MQEYSLSLILGEEIIKEFDSGDFLIPSFFSKRHLTITNKRIAYWKGGKKQEIFFKDVYDISIERRSLNVYMIGALKYDYDPNFESPEMDRPYIIIRALLHKELAHNIACRYFTKPKE